jgi:hypothetical protein
MTFFEVDFLPEAGASVWFDSSIREVGVGFGGCLHAGMKELARSMSRCVRSGSLDSLSFSDFRRSGGCDPSAALEATTTGSVTKALGGEEELVGLWFSTMLHYSHVDTLTGNDHPFPEIGVAALRMVAEKVRPAFIKAPEA